MSKILHIGAHGFLMSGFISFIEDHFDVADHSFYLLVKKRDRNPGKRQYITNINYYTSFSPGNIRKIGKLAIDLNRADKIILHGLNESLTVILLLLMPWNLKRCYWFSWGSDIYKYLDSGRGWKLAILFALKKIIAKRFGSIVVAVEGEYRTIRRMFGTESKRHNCFKYPSNVFKEPPTGRISSNNPLPSVLLGNSAAPSNNHIEALQYIKSRAGNGPVPFGTLYCPLSYGDKTYAKRVKSVGKELFGERFVPLEDFLPLDEYLEFLTGIDIAIFNHRRQQGMGNLVTLLGYGKKVFIRKEITPWEFFKELGVKVYAMEQLEFSRLDPTIQEQNKHIIREYFSEQRLKKELNEIFQD